MKPQTQGFQFSLIIHAVFILGVLGLSTLAANKPRPVVIDFDLEKSISAAPAPVQKHQESPIQKAAGPPSRKEVKATPQPVPREEAKPVPPLETSKVAETSPTWIHSTSDLTVPVEQPGVPNVPGGIGKTDGKVGISGSASASGKGGSGGGAALETGGTEKAKNRYLAEHFAYIRDKIFKNVSYPALARRMGWQGKVVLSFNIQTNGSIKDPQVARGSGYEILDQNALESLKESAPFPRPPVEAQIMIPVVYRLN